MARRAPIGVLLAAAVAAALHAEPAAPTTIAAPGSDAGGAAWVARAETMLHEGSLDIAGVQADTMLPGRTHERLDQRYDGLPVFGGQLVRQRVGQSVLSVWGRIFDNVSAPSVVPAIDAERAEAIAARDAGAGSMAEPAVLGILPEPSSYVLAYRTRVHAPGGPYRYDVDAITGAIREVESEIRDQQAVGSGRGVLGDEKKIAVRPLAVGFQAIDTMRPAAAASYALDGSVARFNAFTATGAVFASDIGFSTVNTWSDAALVDAHAYVGWTYDYYFTQFGRRGMDDRNLAPRIVVHPIARAFSFAISASLRGLYVNNAFNSTIVSHAFYLAVAGGTNRVSGVQVQGIGTANIDRMLRIFYRGFAFFLVPSSQFSDARAATLRAATDLYGAGSNERAQLQQAWIAVGVN